MLWPAASRIMIRPRRFRRFGRRSRLEGVVLEPAVLAGLGGGPGADGAVGSGDLVAGGGGLPAAGDDFGLDGVGVDRDAAAFADRRKDEPLGGAGKGARPASSRTQVSRVGGASAVFHPVCFVRPGSP